MPAAYVNADKGSIHITIIHHVSVNFFTNFVCLVNELLSPQLVHPVAHALQLALPGKLVPNRLRILIRRRDGHDSRLPAARHRTHADPRLIVELREFQPLLEGLRAALSCCGPGLPGCKASVEDMMFPKENALPMTAVGTLKGALKNRHKTVNYVDTLC